MASITGRQLINPQITLQSNKSYFSGHHSISTSFSFNGNHNDIQFPTFYSGQRNMPVAVKSSPGKDGGIAGVDEEGVSLGTMKLPSDTDISRFETLLFQWANSLNQGAQMPLPVPLKVDKIEGGVRLGFVEIDDGKTETKVYIDCQVVRGSNNSGAPVFVATRKGLLKNKVPLGEPRIIKSLLAALKTSVEIARA
ncbi:hypothetical protein SOVF_169070 [Spinacia oleracea]|nr:hypothetical protein SOVF_169070 [Spinacia oleracea]